MNRPATESVSSPAPAATAVPDAEGHYGMFGGSFIPETLQKAVTELGEVYAIAKDDPAFLQEMETLNRDYIGRATPLQFAPRLTELARKTAAESGAKNSGGEIWIKREDLAHTGAHKINNAIGQCLLTIRMGKNRIIAETGAGQHGVATATAAAKFGLECEVFMGTEDMRRQRPNVLRMRLMGAKVTGVESGSKTLKDATNAAMRDWMATSETTHYTIGSVVGPHPFPMIVRDFQSVIGKETYRQCLDQIGRLPDCITACVGGGSNAAGMFHPFATNPEADHVQLVGVEPGGVGTEFGKHAASLSYGQPGVLHGSLSYVLQDDDGQTAPVHSVSAGLDYPGVGPEHAYWKDSGRVTYASVTDSEALEAFGLMSKLEGILPALECSHAMAHTLKLAAQMPRDQVVVMNLSGRGDKDLDEVVRVLKM
ncbi:MAG: tryptophan synthase subunit beta [Planctomycetota bacterium]